MYNQRAQTNPSCFGSWVFCYGFILCIPQIYKADQIFEWFSGFKLTLRDVQWYSSDIPVTPYPCQDQSCYKLGLHFSCGKKLSYFLRECSKSFQAADDINSGKMKENSNGYYCSQSNILPLFVGTIKIKY